MDTISKCGTHFSAPGEMWAFGGLGIGLGLGLLVVTILALKTAYGFAAKSHGWDRAWGLLFVLLATLAGTIGWAALRDGGCYIFT